MPTLQCQLGGNTLLSAPSPREVFAESKGLRNMNSLKWKAFFFLSFFFLGAPSQIEQPRGYLFTAELGRLPFVP